MSYSETVDHMVFSQNEFPQYYGHRRIEKFELVQKAGEHDNGDTGNRQDASNLTAAECARWLQSQTTPVDKSEATLRVLMICTRNDLSANRAEREMASPVSPTNVKAQQDLRVKQASFVKDVFSQAGLPLVGFASYVKTLLTFAHVPPRFTSGTHGREDISQYYCSSPSWAVTWAYHRKTRSTAAVLFYREGDGEARQKDALADLIRLLPNIDHPMMLGYIKTKISLTQIFSLLQAMNNETLKLEQETGLSMWDWSLEREISGQGAPESYDRVIDRFSVLSGKITNIRFRLRTLQEQTLFLKQCNQKHRRSVRTENYAVQKCIELEHMLQVISHYTNVHLHDADSLADRLTNQMTSIFQLTAQKDSRIGLEIAHDTRKRAVQSEKDNSSLKTIAVITFFFLPGTFVASFFAMPLFNWNAPTQDQIVSRRLWVFWAVAVPVTIATALVWLVWFWVRRKTDAEEHANALEDLKGRIRSRIRKASGSKWGPSPTLKQPFSFGLRASSIEVLDAESGRAESC